MTNFKDLCMAMIKTVLIINDNRMHSVYDHETEILYVGTYIINCSYFYYYYVVIM